MNPKLFQSAEFYHRRYHNFATVLVIPATFLVFFLLTSFLIGKKEITVTTLDSIRPTKVIAVVQPSSDNTVLTNNLSENKAVKKGDLLIQYSDKLEDSQLNVTQTQIKRYERQREALSQLKESLEQGQGLFTGDDEFGYSAIVERFLNQSQIITTQVSQSNQLVAKQEAGVNQTNAAIINRIANLQTQASQYQEVKDVIQTDKTSVSGNNLYATTLNSYLSQIQTINIQSSSADNNSTSKKSVKNQFLTDLQEQIDSINTSISSLQTQAASSYSTGNYDTSATNQIESLRQQELTQAETQLAQITQEKENLQTQLDQTNLSKADTILKASQSGILHVSDEFGGQTLLPQGSQIAEIYLDTAKTQQVATRHYVDSTYVSQLKKGQTVRLTLEKISNHAIVITDKIDKIASSATQTKEGNVFEVTALVTVDRQDNPKLKHGLQGKAISTISKKTFFNYYKDKLSKDF